MHIGFVGLGQMGAAMAPHLAAAAYQVTGHDLIRPLALPAGVGFTSGSDSAGDL